MPVCECTHACAHTHIHTLKWICFILLMYCSVTIQIFYTIYVYIFNFYFVCRVTANIEALILAVYSFTRPIDLRIIT
jgi:hypothetical protein